jgi:hypothetical protein
MIASTTSISNREKPARAEIEARTGPFREVFAVMHCSAGRFLGGMRLGRAPEQGILLLEQLLDLAELADHFVALFDSVRKRRLASLRRSAAAAVKP